MAQADPGLQAEVLADWLAVLDRPSVQGVLVWRWLTDPPEWTSVIYFPTVIKMIWGPKHVRSFAYLTAYGALVMSLICLVQSVVGSF